MRRMDEASEKADEFFQRNLPYGLSYAHHVARADVEKGCGKNIDDASLRRLVEYRKLGRC